MSSAPGSLSHAAARRVALRKRPDLIVKVQRYEGRSFYLVKDPAGLRYFRFQEEEYALLELLDGRRSLDEIQERFEATFRPQKITPEEIQQFIGRLHESGLVLSDTLGQGERLLERGRKQRKRKVTAAVTNILYIKLPGFDPERILHWLEPKCHWIFSLWGVLGAGALMFSALTLVIVNFDEFQGRPELQNFQAFFNVRNVVWMWVALGVVKVIHEFGHGVACTHFGGECHEIGLLFLVLTPCLYCNVSDAWMIPNKWHRIWISAAGIYIEVVLASIATFLWWFSEPGLLHNLSFSTMFVCSVSTILFNANPLLRYDGYYIMSDLLEIPNLRIKSTNMVQKVFAYWCMGVETPDDPFTPQSRRWLFVTYAIASYLYRWFISFAILLFLYSFLKPYKLGAISAMLAIGALFSLLVVPAYRLGKFVFSPGRTVAVSKLRIAFSSLVLLGIIVGALSIPLPLRVHAVVTLEPRDADPVYVRQAGRLEAVHVVPGQQVEQGELLAVLSNDAMQIQLEELVRERATAETAMDTFLALGDRGQRELSQKSFEMINALLQERHRQIEELEIRAPSSGTIIPSPMIPEPGYSEHLVALATWHRTPLDSQMLGSYLEPPTPLCSVGDLGKMEAQLVIDQADIEYVRTGDTVWIKLDAFPLETFEATIERIEPVELQVAQRNLTNQAGGELATTTGPGGVERPLHSSYLARVPLDMSLPSNQARGELLRPGLRGRAKIAGRNRTVGQWIWRWVTQTFRFRL